MKRGALVWALLDKRRPAVIVSPDSRNEAAKDVLLVPCSTSARRMRWHVYLGRGEGGLPHESMALCEQVGPLDKEFVGSELGTLSEARMREIERALLSALGIMP